MPREGKRRIRESRQYEVLVVSLGEHGTTRKFKFSRPGAIAILTLAFLATVGLTLATLIYTPVAAYVQLPNPMLEQRYGRQIRETQRRLSDLAGEVMILRDYNQQLRRALGEGSTKDSAIASYPASAYIDDGAAATQSRARAEEPAAADSLGPDAFREAAPQFLTAEEPGVPVRLPMLMPVDGFVSQGFDPSNGHLGMDIAGRRGTPVAAPADGQIVFAGWTYEDGNMLIMAHGGGYLTVYKHNQSLLRTSPSKVRRGEPIALLGTSGRTSQGPHLHFEVWKDGIPHDPEVYLLKQ